MTPYTTVIGLEVHVQLATASKLFCRCATTFGAEPNTQTCPVCIGMPGSLPVMNERAYGLALEAAVALNCNIPAFTKWDRKQYYYPDLPKAYQISQYDLPMSENGYLEISDPKDRFEPKRVGIIRAHLEEDAGKSIHDEVAGKADSEIDLNRTGTPLLEIVSEPDMRSSAEAKAYLQELKLLLSYIGVSDCNMQEGSLRVDANVNLHIDTADGQGRHADSRDQEHEQLPRRRAGPRLRGRAAVARVARDAPEAGRRPQADARLGRRGGRDPRAAFERGIERLPLLPRPRSRPRHHDARARGRGARVAGRAAGRAYGRGWRAIST